MSEKTFEIYPEIKSEKVYFNNRFGTKLQETYICLPITRIRKTLPSRYPGHLVA